MSLTEAWKRNHEITLEFLKSIPADAFGDQYSARTRTVSAQFAHIHYVRLQNLEKRGGKEFLGDLKKFPNGYEATKRELQSALEKSGLAMVKLMKHVEKEQKVRSWNNSPPATWLGYFVAHEAHHRALAVVCCRLGGHKLASAEAYDMWYQWRKPRSARKK